MSKLQNPFGNGKRVLITQTYHEGGNNIAIDCITDNTTSNTPVYAISNGKVTMVSNSAGSYLCKTVDGAGFQEFYVHTARWVVSTGQYVKAGDLLGYIATSQENGGYPMHLHMGLSTGNYIMNYFDRDIDFKTTYQDIANDWFNGNINNPINWGLFQDLSIGDSYNNGDRIIFTGEQNIRVGSGLQYAVESSTYAGMKATIIENPRIADGYTWYNIQVDGGGTGWVADVNKFKHYTDNGDNNNSGDGNISNDMDVLQNLQQKLEEAIIELQGRDAEIEEWKKMYKEETIKSDNLQNKLVEANKTILDLQEDLSKNGNIDNYSTTELLREVVKRVFNFSKKE